jgi:hypothetical protein
LITTLTDRCEGLLVGEDRHNEQTELVDLGLARSVQIDGRPRIKLESKAGGIQLIIAATDRLGLFSETAGLLASHSVQVRSAVLATVNGVAVNTWRVDKQLATDPWSDVVDRYPVTARVHGKVFFTINGARSRLYVCVNGLLGFEIGAGLTARLGAGVTMEVTNVRAEDGKLVAERPILQDSAIVDVGYVSEPGIIIGRLNAFNAGEPGDGKAEVVDVDVELSEWSGKARMRQRGEQRGADVNIEDADILVAGGRGLPCGGQDGANVHLDREGFVTSTNGRVTYDLKQVINHLSADLASDYVPLLVSSLTVKDDDVASASATIEFTLNFNLSSILQPINNTRNGQPTSRRSSRVSSSIW